MRVYLGRKRPFCKLLSPDPALPRLTIFARRLTFYARRLTFYVSSEHFAFLLLCICACGYKDRVGKKIGQRQCVNTGAP
jgi:hypothetical protein